MITKDFVLLFFIFFVVSLATDDLSECLTLCKDKYVGTDSEKEACAVGCDGRHAIQTGPYGFKVCMSGCEKKYNNDTVEGELKSCKFACSLPFEQRFTMTLDTSGGKRKWRVEHQSGEGISKILGTPLISSSSNQKQEHSLSPLSDILLRPKFASNDPPKSSEEDQQKDAMMKPFVTFDEDDFNSPERMDTIVENLMRSMISQAREEFRRARAEAGFKERPNGHQLIALNGPEVGNMADGQSIITEFDDGKLEDLPARRSSQSLRWLILTFAMLFLVISILCVTIFFRRPGLEEYVRMRNAYRHHSETASAGPLSAKKSMIAEDAISTASWQHKEPEGEGPPAYDQVSIHKATTPEEK